MAFLCFIGGIAAFFVVFFDSFGISCFFKLFHFLSMLFSLFSYFSVSLRSLLRPMWQHSVEHSWIHSLLFSFLSVFHWHAINEHANLTFSRSFPFFYVGGKEPLGSRHCTFSHNIDRLSVEEIANSLLFFCLGWDIDPNLRKLHRTTMLSILRYAGCL